MIRDRTLACTVPGFCAFPHIVIAQQLCSMKKLKRNLRFSCPERSNLTMYASAQTAIRCSAIQGNRTGPLPVHAKKENKMPTNERLWSPPQIIWSSLIAIVVWSAIGFSWFGTGFDWKTQGSAIHMSDNIVKENLAMICVAQAQNAPDSNSALKEFAALSSYKQHDFVKNSGWAIMPGSDAETNGVARLCASKLSEV